MLRYNLTLNSEGDGFSFTMCKVDYPNGRDWCPSIIRYDLNSVSPDCIPEYIRRALECTSRKDSLKYIENYLRPQLNELDANNTANQFDFTHNNEKCRLFLKHAPYLNPDIKDKYHNNTDSGSSMRHSADCEHLVDFIKRRDCLFKENYETGYNYDSTPWSDPSWIVTFLKYYISEIRNVIERNLSACFFSNSCSIVSFPNDFNKGLQDARQNLDRYKGCEEESPAVLGGP